jgi:hypothetical protein
MIVKILASSASFSGVRYNHEKIRSGKGELLKVKNFGALMLLKKVRPQDYINYLKSVSAVNKRVSKPQLHAVISSKGKSASKQELVEIAEKWLSAMGYGENPYLIVFHNDTDNHHVHIVSTRVDKDGKKISAAFERVRALRALFAICNQPKLDNELINKALAYRFSTPGQLRTLLEKSGFDVQWEKTAFRVLGSGKMIQEFNPADIENRCAGYSKDEKRVRQLKAIFRKVLDKDLQSIVLLAEKDTNSKLELISKLIGKRTGAELVFHAKDEKQPYGYTIIDHASKSVLKGSEVMPIREILECLLKADQGETLPVEYRISFADPRVEVNYILSAQSDFDFYNTPLQEIELKDDIDDEAINGRNRQRKGKARTNTR